MNALVQSVVPPSGFYCLATIRSGKVKQEFYSDINALINDGYKASARGENAYYAMASFNTDSGRTQANVAQIKSFWLDVDCKNKDPEVDYANKEDGLTAIRQFCKRFGFPKPSIVDSGNGWHVYWILEDAITKADWQPVADKLKAICLNGDLRIDPACTADSARILRIPDTKNYRDGKETDVVLMLQGTPLTLDGFKAIVDSAFDALGLTNKLTLPGTPSKKQLSAVTNALVNNTSTSFKKILMEGKCEQITWAATNQDQVSEPLWRSVLSIAEISVDRDIAIHAVSKNHPSYDAAATEQKASQTGGPHSCQVFDGLRRGVCQNCPQFGKITTPAQLGRIVNASTAPVVVQPPVQEIPDPATPATYELASVQYVIPQPPAPYMRGTNGGLFKRVRAEDGTFDDVLVYENDFYAHTRLYDPEDGQVLACRLHLPLDGIREFNVPLKSVGSRDELRKLICGEGVAASDNTLKELSAYLLASARELQTMAKEEKARTQMGWQNDGTFVVGNREYSPTGIRNCPPSSATTNYQHMFRVEGSLQEWRKVVDIYKRDGFGIQQFTFFYMLASPLLEPVGHTGMLASLISDETGLGKSTIGMLVNSVWGEPVEMMVLPHDTFNAMVSRIGVFNSLGFYCDEYTNKPPQECSDLIYLSTQGKGKNRLTANAVERVNNTRWRQHGLVSANASLMDKVASIKDANEAENMRIFEFDVRGTPIIEKTTADAVFPLVRVNYGVAGHIYASWLVNNRHNISTLVRTMQKQLDARFVFPNKERNWSLSIAAAYTAAKITKKLGLHDFDVDANIDFMLQYVGKLRNAVINNATDHSSVVTDYLTENHSSVLIINGMPDANGLMAPPVNRTIHKINARYEPDCQKLFIPLKNIRALS